MSAKTPIVRQIDWISIIPHLLVMGAIMLIWYQINETNFIPYGAITYIIISQLLRRVIAREHRKGITNVKREQFHDAIPHFEKSYEFFKNNDWVDKYRFLTMLSSGSMTYKEMALTNIAFCHSQIGNGKIAKELYEKALNEYPNNGIAKAALRSFNSISKDN